MTTLTATTASAVSRVLSAAFRKSVTRKSRISGWSNTHEGYVTEQGTHEILVSYEVGDWNRGTGAERQLARTLKLAEIASYLTQKGYKIDVAPRAIIVYGRA